MAAFDYVPTCPDLLLASEGASTDASPERRVGMSVYADTRRFWICLQITSANMINPVRCVCSEALVSTGLTWLAM